MRKLESLKESLKNLLKEESLKQEKNNKKIFYITNNIKKLNNEILKLT